MTSTGKSSTFGRHSDTARMRWLAPRGLTALATLLIAIVAVGCDSPQATETTGTAPSQNGDDASSARSAQPGSSTIAFASVQGPSAAIPTPGAKATVLIFVSSTCPIANGYVPEINRLVDDYGEQGIDLCVVHTEDLAPQDAQNHLEQFGYRCKVLLDPRRELVGVTGATITPEAAVLSPSGNLLYRGRIDDRFPDVGIQKPVAAKTELRDALDAIVAGKPIETPRTRAVGCYIE